MLSDDVAVDAIWRNLQLLADEKAEPGRVKIGATAKDSVLWQAAELPSHVGQDVHWVGNDHQDGVRAVLDQIGDDPCP